jgi:hypothetical protein
VAATDGRDRAGAIIAAALALPGVLAHADEAPEHGEVSLKVLRYRDWQPGFSRIGVTSPSLYVLAPLGPRWSLDGSLVSDSISGATPRYHTAISGASRMKEQRFAEDVRLTRYQDRSTWSIGLSHSGEHDYRSTAASLGASLSSDDSNRTLNLGLGYASDQISSTNDTTLHERKRTVELLAGVTQALSPSDLVQADATFNGGRGYYSDPYKEPDIRPRKRDQGIFLGRWNHHFDDVGSTLRTGYRFYHDTFGINAHTLSLEWVQPLPWRVTLTPSLRYYTQGAARFYYDPVYDPTVGAPYPPGYFTNPPQFISPDQRLSAFGAVTVGLKLGVQISSDWSTDLKAERYEQRSSWRLGGVGSPGLEPFSALFIQLGLNKRF